MFPPTPPSPILSASVFLDWKFSFQTLPDSSVTWQKWETTSTKALSYLKQLFFKKEKSALSIQ